ncbi:hypothetical protein PCO85_02945 [Prodigiosinella aquatilis]|nr:hypothetical protein [Prodigiosinella sp. LS101]WJV56187.1 hypothetical protein PCO85_02945 [Prodigiosinella sp. LS101]WJV60551.1 hypothetical protein PCO84_02955 [Pectobacteriaceae bacterium C111]
MLLVIPLAEAFEPTPGFSQILEDRRDNVYQAARAASRKRWSRQTRNWHRQDSVTLNPEREKQAV